MNFLGYLLLGGCIVYLVYQVIQIVKEVKSRKRATPCDDNNKEKEKK